MKTCNLYRLQSVAPQAPGIGVSGGASVASAAGGGGPSYTRTFTLPGGGRGTVLISSSVGVPSMGGGTGGAPDPFMQGVLEAMMGGGFLHPGGGAPGYV